jgi:hypothetical protein
VELKNALEPVNCLSSCAMERKVDRLLITFLGSYDDLELSSKMRLVCFNVHPPRQGSIINGLEEQEKEYGAR